MVFTQRESSHTSAQPSRRTWLMTLHSILPKIYFSCEAQTRTLGYCFTPVDIHSSHNRRRGLVTIFLVHFQHIDLGIVLRSSMPSRQQQHRSRDSARPCLEKISQEYASNSGQSNSASLDSQEDAVVVCRSQRDALSIPSSDLE